MQSRDACKCDVCTSNATAVKTWWSWNWSSVLYGDVGEYFASAEKDAGKTLSPDDKGVFVVLL